MVFIDSVQNRSVKFELMKKFTKRYSGFIALGFALAIVSILRNAEAEPPQTLLRVLFFVLVIGFVGQFVLSWKRSNGFEILILVNFGLVVVLPIEAIQQLITLQMGVVGLILYVYPSILLFRRNHERKYLYALVNFILGVYIVPWIIILRIALKTPRISKKRFH